MTKTITLTGANGEPLELVLSNRVAWLMEYRDQFNRDIVPSLMPMLLSISELISGLAEENVDFNDISAEDIFRLLGSEFMTDAAIKLSALEFVDFLNIIWALNKAADESIPEPKKWIRQFDEFPLDEIVPDVAELVVKGVVSSKNWDRLTEASKKLKPAKNKKKTTR